MIQAMTKIDVSMKMLMASDNDVLPLHMAVVRIEGDLPSLTMLEAVFMCLSFTENGVRQLYSNEEEKVSEMISIVFGFHTVPTSQQSPLSPRWAHYNNLLIIPGTCTL
jgi:hypothetical protein